MPAVSMELWFAAEAQHFPMNGLREYGHGLCRPVLQMVLAGGRPQALHLLGSDIGQCFFAIESQLFAPGTNTRNRYRPLSSDHLRESGMVGPEERSEGAE